MNLGSPSIRTCVAKILFVIVLAAAAKDAQAGDPDLVFRTIKTENFRVHYHQGLEPLARKAASICEEVHDKMAVLFGWEVPGPIEVIVTDGTDSANGSARVIYRPEIRLYATGPELESALQEHDNWLYALIVHEYTHINHLQIHSGVSRVVNSIFGDIYLPNQIAPRWLYEGIAVLEETYFTTAGRIRSSQFRMAVRSDVLADRLLRLDELSNSRRKYPRGHDDYIYGALFIDYLYRRYGHEEITELAHIYGGAPLPYGLNRAFREAFGEDLVTLYGDWIQSVREETALASQRLRRRGLTVSKALTDDGDTKGQPVYFPDGSKVALAIGSGERRSGIFAFDPETGRRELIAYARGDSSVSIDAAGRVFYSRTAPFKNNYFFSDVFVVESPGGEPRRLTHGLRAREVAVNRRGDRLAVTVNDAGTTDLVMTDDRGGRLATLIDSAPFDQVYAPVWSPGGDEVAVIMRRGPRVDLVVVDVATGRIRMITDDSAIERRPTYDPTGRFLVFPSDRTGISNIYAYDLREDRLIQLTNVLTGAFDPAVSPDGGRLLYLNYSSWGYDLHATSFTPEKGLEPGPPSPFPPHAAPDLPRPSSAADEDYNPLVTLVPNHWSLTATTSSSGDTVLQLITALTDAVPRHSVGAELEHVVGSESVLGRFAYAYYGLGPSLHVGFSRSFGSRDDGFSLSGEQQPWYQEVLRASASLSVPIYAVDRSHRLGLGYSVLYYRPLGELDLTAVDPNEDDAPSIPKEGFRAGIDLSWYLSDTYTSPYGVSPEQGRSVSASVSLYHPAFGGTQKLATVRYSWNEYVLMPWLSHHVLALRLSGGAYISDPPNQNTFSFGGYQEQNIVDVIWNNTSAGLPGLRGYPVSSVQGSHYEALRADYRFPLWWSELGYHTLPLFLRRLQAGVFTDNILVSSDTLKLDDWRSSVGAELVWNLTFGYHQPMTLRTGYARGLMDGGTNELIFVFGGSF